MTFAAPWLLLALVALPLLWWLLRVVPPAPRLLTFPAVRLLLGLEATEQTTQRTPPWVLALRIAAAALVIAGLAGPLVGGARALPGRGPLLLVVDNGWAAATDWPDRMQAAMEVVQGAQRSGRAVALLATAGGVDGGLPRATPPMPAAEVAPRLAVLRPQPFPIDRAAAAAAVRAARARSPGLDVVFVSDGLTDGPGWAAFASALEAGGSAARVVRAAQPPAQLILAPLEDADALRVRVAQAPRPQPTRVDVLAQTADGRGLARVPVTIAAGAEVGTAPLRLPNELRNQIERLVIAPGNGGAPGAGGVFLLDEGFRRRPVGLLRADQASDTPLSGASYFIKRALGPFAEVREGDLETLLSRPLSVLVLPDVPLVAGPEADRMTKWVQAGGLLLRFAGPAMAQGTASGDNASGDTSDPLLPVPLLGYERELGGALSWTKPASLAAFPAGSPFHGLPAQDDVKVSKQVLADPASDVAAATWASLADGTPLVTHRALGEGQVVLFHITANADWSTLPMSGLFVQMLRRIVALSAGVSSTSGSAGAPPLAPTLTIDGLGELGDPPPGALAIAARAFASTVVSAAHPPGLYGPESDRRALNLSANLTLPERAQDIAGATLGAIGVTPAGVDLGPWLLTLAGALLGIDLLVSIALRGLWRRAAWAAGAVAGLLLLGTIGPGGGALALEPAEPNPALSTRLAYVVSGDATVDDVARSGLAGLSAYVNARTAAELAEPAAVTLGQDDLSFYPLLYWPIVPDAPAPTAAAVAALNNFTAHGGVILIDTRDADGSGAPSGGRAVLRALAAGGAGGLQVPPLAPLTSDHVLARSFYLLTDFPGRYAGSTIWVARDQDRSNDSVSPVVVGGLDWAAAWAVDANGRHPYATLPGGERQRTLAYRFGVNLVMYALTGNYKGDQVHVPALLERLGQ